MTLREESEGDASRARRSSELFGFHKKRRKQRHESQRAKASAPVDVDPTGEEDLDLAEFDPKVHDYHQSAPRRQLTPVVEDPEAEVEAAEREAKRLVASSANYVDQFSAFLTAKSEDYT